MLKSTCLDYSLLLLASTGKKSFTNLGKIIKKSSDTVRRMLSPEEKIFTTLDSIAKYMFKGKKELVLSIDDTLIKKFFSKSIEGTDKFFDTKTNGMIMSYKLLVGALTDGKHTIPVQCNFLLSKAMATNAAALKEELVQTMITKAQKMFPNKIIIVAADGAFATRNILKWALGSNVKMEVRMHSNRVISYKGERVQIRKVADLVPKGRHMAHTIQAMWGDLLLHITAHRRIDRHGEETIVYQAATYKAAPAKHVAIYKKRWFIEKLFRTTKQSLGLQECFSTKLNTQSSHVAFVLLAYALAQIEMKKHKHRTPEEAIRSFKHKDFSFLKSRLSSLGEIFGGTHA